MNAKILIRPDNFNMRYQHWKDTRLRVQLEMLRGSYANEVFGKGSEDLDFESSVQHAHIVWQPQDLDIEDLSFMSEHMRDLLSSEGYITKLSDERSEILDHGRRMTVQRHFMKSDKRPGQSEGHKPDFGAVFLEHRFNRELNLLSISSNYHGGKSYISFERLMELLLK